MATNTIFFLYHPRIVKKVIDGKKIKGIILKFIFVNMELWTVRVKCRKPPKKSTCYECPQLFVYLCH